MRNIFWLPRLQTIPNASANKPGRQDESNWGGVDGSF